MDISELEENLAEFLPEKFTIKKVKGQICVFTHLKETVTGDLISLDEDEEDETYDLEDSDDEEDDLEIPEDL